MKKHLIWILPIVFTGIFYLMIGFVKLTLNPIEWAESERTGFVVCSFVLIIMCVLIGNSINYRDRK
jgi:hypothetical protein